MNDIKAVIFDLYNTLIYFKNKTKPYDRLFSDLELTPEEKRFGRRIALTKNFKDLADFITQLEPKKQLNYATYEEEIKKEVSSATLYPETKDTLKELRKRGIKLGLISNLASPYKKPFFDLELDEYFSETLFSCDLELIKPDPKIYQEILKKFSFDPNQVLMIGDNICADVVGPKSVGLNAIHLDRYNNSPNSIHSLEKLLQTL